MSQKSLHLKPKTIRPYPGVWYNKHVWGLYHRLGILSAIPVIPAMMLLWEIITPFGMPVDPLVYMMTAMSEGSGVLRSRVAGMSTEKGGGRTGLMVYSTKMNQFLNNPQKHGSFVVCVLAKKKVFLYVGKTPWLKGQTHRNVKWLSQKLNNLISTNQVTHLAQCRV